MTALEFKPISVFAPISIGNVSVGFDTLGLALSPIDGSLVGDIVHIEILNSSNSESNFILTGTHAHKLTQVKEENIVWLSMNLFNANLKKQAIKRQAIKITLEKNLSLIHI